MTALFVILSMAGGGLYWMLSHPDRIQHYVRDSVALRTINEICFALDSGQVSQEEVCAKPLTEIPRLRATMLRRIEQDRDWMITHGFVVNPQINCGSDNTLISFRFIDRTLVCNGKSAEISER